MAHNNYKGNTWLSLTENSNNEPGTHSAQIVRRIEANIYSLGDALVVRNIYRDNT